jgi:enoyl reductase-like protein
MGTVVRELSTYFSLMRMYHSRQDADRPKVLKGSISLQAMNEQHPAIKARLDRLVDCEMKRLEAG